ncbi:protein of unknown function [Desulfoluna spongiiphila]|uniref:DUF4154 domain-containing protein n=1 Tax=Desulfoluna spongiiphila TaxID=419481 RepID=A0A1G5FJP1_9BACT|nr:protein of unknown function [Desulfoluna spongiiphila]
MTYLKYILRTCRVVSCTALIFPVPLISGPKNTLAATLDEPTVKAAFVLNFARYTQWPEDRFETASAPCELTVFGGEGVEEAFQRIEGKPIGTRRLKVRFTHDTAALDGSHIIFFCNGTPPGELARALEVVKEDTTLTIGDEMPRFLGNGGLINMFKKNDRLRFEINVERALQVRLKFRSRLLRHAIIVGGP